MPAVSAPIPRILPVAALLALGLGVAATPARADTLLGLVSTGELFTSADNGAHWSIRSTLPVRDAVALQARTSANDFYLASASGTIYRSTDAGLAWYAVGAAATGDLVDLAIRGDGHILLLTGSGDIYRSADLGVTFTPLATLGAANCVSLAGRPDGRLFVLTATGEVYRSTDGGTSWTVRGTIATSEAVRLRAAGATLHVISASGDDYRSGDEGTSWVAVGTLSQVGTAALVVNSGTLVAATTAGMVATSGDGTTWIWQGSIDQLTLTALAVDTPAVSGVENPGAALPAVGQPWPNPAPAGTGPAIPITLSAPEQITVRLFDTAGRLVAMRGAGTLPAGAHTLRLELEDFASGSPASGLYLVRVDTPRGTVGARRWLVAR